ncbi:hypothetical protein QJS10_CPB11g01598 [Acorus calamus]|uniref:Uncharacterized protein n=1 Tax=Acorus calamus TaxID=4465 RepID=A0AAV9DRU0_ACOCL|nr:hypothetical protein QJS10_CPB11g01598 [Acorus calamus]
MRSALFVDLQQSLYCFMSELRFYMAIERSKMVVEIRGQSGAIMYEMLLGYQPFYSEHPMATTA